MPKEEAKAAATKDLVPLLPLRGVIVFPYMTVPLDVGRDRSVAALEDAMMNERLILLAAQKQAKVNEPAPKEIHEVGTISEVKQLARYPDGTIRVLVDGIQRARIVEYVQVDPFYKVRVEPLEVSERMTKETEALMRSVLGYFESYVRVGKKIPTEVLTSVQAIEDPGRLADDIAAHLPLRTEDKQRVLEAASPKLRLERLCAILLKEMEILELEKKINSRVRKQMEKTQKEYYLREQMKAIQKELGERDDRSQEGEEYREKIAAAKLPKEVEERALREVERLEKMPPMAAEAVVVRTYLDWLLTLPWTYKTQDRLDIEAAAKVLDEDHYGLEKVKERILEFLAVRQLTTKLKGPILCLVGPPGVGKTSLGKSIARALDRKFVRFSLGGVRDEAEIRGHRRTYVGALPGKIIQAMRQAGSKNPVILLDEVDKMSYDFRGDPSSALLEVLDPEQNVAFGDHYIEIPFDLSDVMFITTANVLHAIPRALADRMEIISIPGYTEEEKVQIGLHFLVPKQVRENGLGQYDIEFTEGAIRTIIRQYTREAGVRGLEREVSSILRKIAKRVVKESAGAETPRVVVDSADIEGYLGIPQYRYGVAESEDRVGVATGLAVTEVGGDILAIEVSVMKGTGKLTLTGKLGDVMKESAQAGFTYIRSRADELGIDPNFYQDRDVHIHVPEGAIPKDGPSAGIAMATALASALSGRPVRCDIAMTGEITLRGRVLPVGGVKEKVVAAHRAGVLTVVLPGENRKDVEEIAKSVLEGMKLVFVDHMDEVLEVALQRREELRGGERNMDDEDERVLPAIVHDSPPAPVPNQIYYGSCQ
ncbi:MAG: endopeptidase La [Clostridia bacterium]